MATNHIANELKSRLNAIRSMAGKLSDKESLVADAYNNAWTAFCKSHKAKADILRVCKCDAYWVGKLNVLVEYKYDIDMENPDERGNIIAQIIAYYRKISMSSEVKLATVAFAADVNECFAMHVNYLNKFVNLAGVDWTLPPNRMGEDPILKSAIIADDVLNNNLIVFNTADADFSEEKIFNTITELDAGVIRVVPITEGTIKLGFDYFSTKIVDRKKFNGKANELVGMYFDFIKNDDTKCHLVGNKIYFTNYRAITVNATRAAQFRSRFGVFSDNDKQELERMYDTLLSESERRFNGQFFTPKIWVDCAHQYMAKVLGDDWESTIPTWDCCCGTKSLTRDYEFGTLFLSTLEQSELNASESLSTEAEETFKFDFLNDGLEHLPESLVKRLKKAGKENTPFAMIINPPYGQGGSGHDGTKTIQGVTQTMVHERMLANGLGKPANELTVQFLYRILELVHAYNLKNVVIGCFSNPAWMTGDACEAFRKEWLSMFNFEHSFGFRSEEFTDVKAGWSINFSVWSRTPANKPKHQTEFNVDLIENMDGNELKFIGTHVCYSMDGRKKLSEWVRSETTSKTFEFPNTTDGIKIKTAHDGTARGRWCSGSLGCAVFYSNSVDKNAQFVNLMSIPFSGGNCFNILPDNIDRVVSGFAARRLIDDNVWNHQDCYMVPNTSHHNYADWQKDCYIFSMFDSKSNQSSIKCEVDGKEYEFVNQFYPLTKEETYDLLSLQKKANFKNDARYIRSSGKLDDLTSEGQAVLDAFKACLKASASARSEYAKDNPTLQVARWDCGWRQLKGLFAEACPEELKVLKERFNVLKDKMRPLVYELGFLKA